MWLVRRRQAHAARSAEHQELLDYRRDPFDTFPPLSILARVGALATRKLDTRGVLGSAYGANYAPAYMYAIRLCVLAPDVKNACKYETTTQAHEKTTNTKSKPLT